MGNLKIFLQKFIYAFVFCAILPVFLVFWTSKTESLIQLPVPDFPILSIGLSIVGFVLIIGAMLNLWFKGKGLPMNGFPPKNYVSSGLYGLFHHPIYVGAVFVSFGVSMYFQSASGFWLISPIFILLILAYVNGFENEIISKSFNHQTHRTFFDFPENNQNKLSLKNRLLLYVWIFLPWILIYQSFIFLGTPNDAISTKIALDNFIPFYDFSVIPYVLAYPIIGLIPFLIQTNQVCRKFIFDTITGMCIIFYCYLVFPFIVEYHSIDNVNHFTNLIITGRTLDGETAALPSFHVFWALIFLKYFSIRFPNFKFLGWIISILIILSCLTTFNHTILDVLFGVLAFYMVDKRIKIYQKVLAFCERISNSWKEWRIGKIRIINHGIYAALGGISGFLIMGICLPDNLYIIYLIGISGFIGAGLWAQFVEGSPALLRPYGYYGSIIGVFITIVFISVFSNFSFFYLLGIASLAASPIQFFGRFRCLVQGCCHGKPTTNTLGICFNHPKSRVNKIAGWAGKNLFPTQFYSIASNFLTFFILIRLVSLGLPVTFITGIYLILNGSFRFVEESLRGEPQTPYFSGMRVYQWLALISIVVGIIFTCFESEPFHLVAMNWNLVLNSLFYGFIILFAYGIDFPESNKRFSRLTQ